MTTACDFIQVFSGLSAKCSGPAGSIQVVLLISLQYQSKPLTTTASSAYMQPCTFRQLQCGQNQLFSLGQNLYTTKSITVACSMLQKTKD